MNIDGEFQNTQDRLEQQVPLLLAERCQTGLEGLVGGPVCVIVNTEPEFFWPAVGELVHYTGLSVQQAFHQPAVNTCVLRAPGSADILVQSRLSGDNPFAPFNDHPKSRHLPNTRLETFVFQTPDIQRYVAIQRGQGVKFLTEDVIRTDHYQFIQTAPSALTGNSVGVLQWTDQPGNYAPADSTPLEAPPPPTPAYRQNVKELDHVATRLRAEDRDPAMMEFMRLTNYVFDFSIYVENLNSITNVVRMPGTKMAMVFTSGIAPYVDDETSGPTEKFVQNYGPRTHHMAFRTEHIDDTFAALKADDMKFLIELVGSETDGLKQTFTQPSRHTLIVTEYIQRYGTFTGFFTKSNVTALTRATGKQ